MWLSRVVSISLCVFAVFIALQYRRTGFRAKIEANQVLPHYDYIIVGAGTAGCVLASRLSENTNVSVLLVEAGGSDLDSFLLRWLIGIPSTTPILQLLPDLNWKFHTTSQDFAARGFINKQILWPAGKLLGGTSATNYMLYTRGLPADYDAWASKGATGWSFKDVEPYFRKVEEVLNQATTPASSVYFQELTDTFIKAGKQMLQRRLVKEDDTESFVQMVTASKGGTRWHAAYGYLYSAMDRPNLHVLINTYVTKIKLAKNRTTGVEMETELGIKMTIRAVREVILSAGAVNSPLLLMRSGIGPRLDLHSIQIPVVADLPVGRNLQDHIFLPIQVRFNSSVSFTEAKAKSIIEILKYIFLKRGILSEAIGMSAEGRIRLNDDTRPDLYLYLLNIGSTDSRLYQAISGLQEEAWRSFASGEHDPAQQGCFIAPAVMHPRARGSITLANNRSFSDSHINPRYLDNDVDVDVLVEGIKMVEVLVKTEAFQSLGAKVVLPTYSAFSHLSKGSDEYYKMLARYMAMTVYHYVGTCRMGQVDDPDTVVDDTLKVKTVSGLRVADASVMPDLPSGNPMGAVLMIAEKAAEMIKHSDLA